MRQVIWSFIALDGWPMPGMGGEISVTGVRDGSGLAEAGLTRQTLVLISITPLPAYRLP